MRKQTWKSLVAHLCILHWRHTSQKKIKKLKRQKKWLHMCTRIQRRSTASNRGDKTSCFKVAFLPAERLLDTFWQGGKRSSELWMVSLFKSQHFRKRKIEQNKQNHNCVNGALKLSAQLKQHTVPDVVVQWYYTSTQPVRERIHFQIYTIRLLFGHYSQTHKDAHLRMSNVSHACWPVLYIVSSSAAVLHHVC